MNNILYKLLKYSVQALAIYLILRFLPELTNVKMTMTSMDSVIITIIIMLIYILFENLCGLYGMSKDEKEQLCSTVCESKCTKEPMGNIPNSFKQDLQYKASSANDKDARMAEAKAREAKHGIIAVPDVEQQTPMLDIDPINRFGSRAKNDLINDDMKYTDYNHLPMAQGYDSRNYEYGYSFLPPEKWYPQPPYPPVCVAEKECPVCPINTSGAPTDMKEWNDSRRVMPPDRINTDYINKLNAGR